MSNSRRATCRSKGVAGKGTAISLNLPRLAAELQPVAGPEVSDENPAGGRGTALIVEDNELMRGTMEMMTESLGYQVLTASGAAEALRLIGGSASVDIMISDIGMSGGINGLELRIGLGRFIPVCRSFWCRAIRRRGLRKRAGTRSRANLPVKNWGAKSGQPTSSASDQG